MLQKLITILYLSGDPISIKKLATLLETDETSIKNSLPELEHSLITAGLVLLISNEGISIVTHPSQSALVEAYWKEELKGELTPAQLQVLTLVAYLGNGTREEISYIRGVQSALSIRTLSVRGLITRNNETCLLTSDSLKQLGIARVEDLPEYETIHKELREKLDLRNI